MLSVVCHSLLGDELQSLGICLPGGGNQFVFSDEKTNFDERKICQGESENDYNVNINLFRKSKCKISLNRG